MLECFFERGSRLETLHSLRTKGLAVVLVLLAFEIVILGCLYLQIEQAETEARHEEKLKDIAAHTEKLGRVLWESRRQLNRYLSERDQASWDAYRRLSDELPPTVDWLKAQGDFNNEQKLVLLRIEKKLNQCLSWLLASKTKMDSMSPSESIEFLNDSNNSMLMVYQTLINDIIHLSKLTDQRLEQGPFEQRRLRESNRRMIFAGVIANIVLVIALSVIFTRNITDRIKIMVLNTILLKQSKELQAPVSGRDEIASLDAAFHQMACDLAEAQRVKQAFVAMISHELRTPLTSVRGFLELLSMGALGEVSKQAVEQSERVHANVERLIKLINDLLDLEKMEAGKMQMSPESISLNAVVEQSLESVTELSKKGEVQIQVEPFQLDVFADADRLEQVLVNLLSNAIKFSNKNSKVFVSAEPEGDFVRVSVKDSGRGIPSDQQELIFERYTQVDIKDGSKKGGTGLGLPVCKLIVEELGGKIGVHSKENQGSTFWFLLPIGDPSK